LRGWDDYERYSLKLTASKTYGMEHMALRARSPQALERRVAALKGSGFDIGWTDGVWGRGRHFVAAIPTAISSSFIAPDWKPIVWTEEERKKGHAWGLKTIESFHTHGTPPVAHK
jgi:hypothetical protein